MRDQDGPLKYLLINISKSKDYKKFMRNNPNLEKSDYGAELPNE